MRFGRYELQAVDRALAPPLIEARWELNFANGWRASVIGVATFDKYELACVDAEGVDPDVNYEPTDGDVLRSELPDELEEFIARIEALPPRGDP